MKREDVINQIIKKYNLINPNYLEIGVCAGMTFKYVNSTNKDGVDPEFYEKCEYVNYKMTSNEFFENHIQKKYDIIFIDGLHVAYQVTIDLMNSLKHLTPGGFIIFDDVYPHHENEQWSFDQRRLGVPLTGDVWKAVYNVLDELISISSDKYFINKTERGSLAFKVEQPEKNITLDSSIPKDNYDGWHPVEWSKYSYQNDFPLYLERISKFNKTIL